MPIELGDVYLWLSQARAESARRWACVFGMLGQPFWFYAAWQADQWGIFVVCVLYALAWMKGLWVYWIKPRRSRAGSRVGTIQFAPEIKK
ncbi:hypothetical protein G7047_14350 [Diaphorobacter sp. HDW4A]|uniref:hypothetical protein n=1 Tax=Diaphorobacter sp. HDW4A TaxID=2714924 RepID=UPI00140DEDCE|nr:hypothetical protein [Diaphorobacter sp. HDW4A]QIL83897.1 hypothetical protein G7047_14350 [Diaphorobacter sp. HDW4A]